jgi:transketolase
MKRFEAYGWHTEWVKDGDNDLAGIEAAIRKCQQVTDKPSVIKLTTTIGFGSKLAGTGGVHGNPLKADDAQSVKKLFGFNPEESFAVPQQVYDMYHQHAAEGAAKEQEWNQLFEKYQAEHKTEGADLARRLSGKLPEGWEKKLPVYKPTDAAVASRKLSEACLEAIHDVLPELVSGSADLTGSNNTRWKNAVDFQPPDLGIGEWAGRYIRYGVREHAMAAVMNGLAAYGTIIPAGGTFLNFVSYAAGALRLSALSRVRVIHIATHDSIGLGEDGPTHQPIETLAHFRALPNCMVWRPADGNETSAAYYSAITSKHTPTVMALTRQNLPQLELSTIESALKGGYVAVNTPNAAVTIVSTGSEVSIAIEAATYLQEKHGVAARVVSIPCFEVFDAQSKEYRLQVLPDGIPVLSVEACSTMGWERYSHEQFGLNRFGASGPYKEVYAVSYRHSCFYYSLLIIRRNSSSPPRASASVLLPPSTSTRASPCARPLTVLSSRSCKERNEYDVTKCFGFLIEELWPSRYTRMRIEHSIVHIFSNPKAYLGNHTRRLHILYLPTWVGNKFDHNSPHFFFCNSTTSLNISSFFFLVSGV